MTIGVIGAMTEATTAVTAETTAVTGDRDCCGKPMTRRQLGRSRPLLAALAIGLGATWLSCTDPWPIVVFASMLAVPLVSDPTRAMPALPCHEASSERATRAS